MTFIIHFKDGHRETYSNHYNENDENERDVAWDDAYDTFPNAKLYRMIPTPNFLSSDEILHKVFLYFKLKI